MMYCSMLALILRGLSLFSTPVLDVNMTTFNSNRLIIVVQKLPFLICLYT